jgi:UPF0755 protein
MDRLIKGLFLLFGMGAAALFIGFAGLFVLSDGDPIDYVQTALLRFSLAGREDALNTPYSDDSSARRFQVRSGETPRLIAANLQQSELIRDDELFVDYVRVEGLDRALEAGTYFLRQTQTIPEIARTLTDSRNSSITFRIIEGQRIEEIADLIDRNPLFGFSGADFLVVVAEGTEAPSNFAQWVGLPVGAALEGFLFPDTYLLPPDITALELRTILLDNFVERVGIQVRQDAMDQGFTMREVVTLASIVEREALHDDENPLVASVYLNRLDIGMKLDADPTVQYGLDGLRGDTWWPQITQADYRNVQSRYNTYLYNGLPPGPIANPGVSAIRGVVYPAESEYIFFRARCDGSGYHAFALTFDGHLANGCT